MYQLLLYLHWGCIWKFAIPYQYIDVVLNHTNKHIFEIHSQNVCIWLICIWRYIVAYYINNLTFNTAAELWFTNVNHIYVYRRDLRSSVSLLHKTHRLYDSPFRYNVWLVILTFLGLVITPPPPTLRVWFFWLKYFQLNAGIEDQNQHNIIDQVIIIYNFRTLDRIRSMIFIHFTNPHSDNISNHVTIIESRIMQNKSKSELELFQTF